MARGGSRVGQGTTRRTLTPRLWHECVAVACGFHACVVGQSIYEPQLRSWMNTFTAAQLLVLTLDEVCSPDPRFVY